MYIENLGNANLKAKLSQYSLQTSDKDIFPICQDLVQSFFGLGGKEVLIYDVKIVTTMLVWCVRPIKRLSTHNACIHTCPCISHMSVYDMSDALSVALPPFATHVN